jgi:hypothetical protein
LIALDCGLFRETAQDATGGMSDSWFLLDRDHAPEQRAVGVPGSVQES